MTKGDGAWRRLRCSLSAFVRGTEGQDLIEYALLAATIALGALAGMTAVKDSINSEFTTVGSSITAGS